MKNFWDGFEKYAERWERRLPHVQDAAKTIETWGTTATQEFFKSFRRAFDAKIGNKPDNLAAKLLQKKKLPAVEVKPTTKYKELLKSSPRLRKRRMTKRANFLERFFNPKEKEDKSPQWGVKLNLGGDVGDNAQDQGGMFTTSPSSGSDVHTGRNYS